MKGLETNDWLVLNNIIYHIYTTDDGLKMRTDFLEQLKMLLDFDAADFYLAPEKEGDPLLCPAVYDCDGVSADYLSLPYAGDVIAGGKSVVFRETDLIDEAQRKESAYFKKVYRRNNWNYSLIMVLAREKQFVGLVTLYRSIGKDNFEYNDIFLLDMLKEHLSFRLYQERRTRIDNPHKWTVVEAAEVFHLTGREEMVLQCIMEGKDKEEICEELSISINTFKKHSLNIYRKLGVNNRVQLFKKILEKE